MRAWTGWCVIALLFAAQAVGQQNGPNAAGSKLTSINDIIVSSPLTASGGAAATGVTGPTVTLGVAAGSIGNSLLTSSSVTVSAGSGLSGGGTISLGGSTTLSLVTPLSKTQLPSTTAFTDQANSFTGNQGIAGNLTISGGNLNLPATASSSVGVITLGGNPFLHNYGTNNGCCTVGNTFVGQFAGNFSSSVSNTVNGNTGVGYGTLASLSTGSGNTATGYDTLARTNTGFANTAVGLQALFDNEGGFDNTGLGFEALETNVTGHDNIAIGFGAGSGASYPSAHSYNIYIGNNGTNEDNTIRIGDSNQTRFFAAGISNATVTGSGVVVDSNGQLGVATSSRRFKYDIEDMNNTTDKLLGLRPVTFRYKQAQSDGSHPLQYGLIAEEVADVYPELVQDSPDGEPYAVRYQVLPAMLLNVVQKQHRQIEAQRQQIQSLQEKLAELASQTQQLQAEMAAFQAQNERDRRLAAFTPEH